MRQSACRKQKILMQTGIVLLLILIVLIAGMLREDEKHARQDCGATPLASAGRIS